MSTERTIGLWIIYICISILSSAANLASYQRQEYQTKSTANRDYREDLALSIAMGWIPIVGWIVILFASGFYEKGFQFGRRKD